MDITSCEICLEKFSAKDHIPKILNCGHTFCSECIGNILKAQKTCSKCEVPLTKSSLEDFITNFSLIDTKEKVNVHSNYFPTVIKILRDLREEFLQEKKILQQKMEENEKLDQYLTRDLKSVQLTLDEQQDGGGLGFNEVEKLIKELEINRRIKISFNRLCNETYSLASFRNTKGFLKEILSRIHEGEAFCALSFTNCGKARYGKIVLLLDRLFIYALTSPTVEENTSVVLLQDIKKCLPIQPCITKQLLTFIEIEGERLTFSLTSSSSLAQHFIKLCTGETGSTFKGSGIKVGQTLFFQSGIVSKSIEIDGNKNSVDLTDYNLNLFFIEKIESNSIEDIVVKMNSKSNCTIEKFFLPIFFASTCSPVAKLLSSQIDVFDKVKNGDLVNDCGIYFPLDL